VARREDRIAELPAPRRRKPLPTRRATWIVLLHGDEVLLERRPGAGVWGGLWAFPEPPAGYGTKRGKRLAPFEHGFTHFRLRVQPLLYRVEKLPSRAEAPGRIWLPLEEAMRAAVPAPVRALLAQLAGQ
jgi:A/G-specific adenine glycosylase